MTRVNSKLEVNLYGRRRLNRIFSLELAQRTFMREKGETPKMKERFVSSYNILLKAILSINWEQFGL